MAATSPRPLRRLSNEELLERRLVNLYGDTVSKLVKTIAAKRAKGSLANFERELLADVMRVLDSLDQDVKLFAELIDGIADDGANTATEAVRRAQAQGGLPAPVSFGSIHKAAVENIVDNMLVNLTEAHAYVGRHVQDVWRRVSLQAVVDQRLQGFTLRQAQRSLMQEIEKQGLGAFRDSRGRVWRLDTYAQMVVRTASREASNTGTIMQFQALGEDLVRMTSHPGSCSLCSPYAGRVFSISGRDSRYPALSLVPGFDKGYWTVHPNCLHSISPYVEALADDPERDRVRSNAPFEDKRPRAEVEAYEKEQTKKRQRMADRKQWESYLALLPEKTPTTFSGFRAMKRANSERYRDLLAAGRSARSV